jgi:hypothetical protein
MSQFKRDRAALCAVVAFLLAPLCSTEATAGDAFLKGGVIFQPRDIGFEGRWRVAFGSDYAVNFSETVYLGFELQTSVYRQDVVGSSRTATLFPANGFVNVKYKSGSIGARPYGGGGLGLISAFTLLSGNNDWQSEFGFQLVGGVELGSFSVELQLQRPFESGFEMTYALYAGFVW